MDTRDLDHYLREIEQIRLIQEKLIKRMEAVQQADRKETFDEAVECLGRMLEVVAGVRGVLAARQVDKEYISKLGNDLRTPLVPISTYTKMLLSGKFGNLSEQQAQRLRIVDSNIDELAGTISDLLENARSQNNQGKGDTRAKDHKIQELEQEKMILDKIIEDGERRYRRLSRKHVVTIAAAAVVLCSVIVVNSLLVINNVGREYRVNPGGPINDGYVIQDLQGQTINTWLSWRLGGGTVLHINVIDAGRYPVKLDLIKEVVYSQKAMKIDDSLLGLGPQGSTSIYYMGWEGALLKASSKPTEFYIPDKFDVISSSTGEGDITVRLTDQRSGDGYSGYTRSIADPANHQILKSEIMIYQVDKLSNSQFEAVFRHEFGHALGLAHSTDPHDLMHATIQTEYPYISPCDIDAIRSLYNGSERSQVACGTGT